MSPTFQLVLNIPCHFGDARCSGRHVDLTIGDENFNSLVLDFLLRNRIDINVSFANQCLVSEQIDVVGIEVVNSIPRESQSYAFRELKQGIISLCSDDEEPINTKIAKDLWVVCIEFTESIFRINADSGCDTSLWYTVCQTFFRESI